MKLNLLGFSLFLCFEAVSALDLANIGQVHQLDNGSHHVVRRSSDQKVKPFNIELNCIGVKCKKVSEAINKLANTVSRFIQVKNQINIKADYISYCEISKVCNLADEKIIGAGMFKYLNLKNKDGVEISYPRPLYKQLVEPSKDDNFKSTKVHDIVLYFNSDDKYWFEGDGDIKDGQHDFTLVAARTLIRGLGVDYSITKLGNYEFSLDPKLENDTNLSTYETIFTPRYEVSSNSSGPDRLNKIKFQRYILDTLMVTTSDGKSINSLLDPFVEFSFPNEKIPSNEIVAYLKKTPLNEASQKIDKLFNTPDSLTIKLPSGNSVALETTIKDKETLYSLYFNETKYSNTKDALLTAKVIKSEARLPSEKKEDWPTYPFGPVLIETLELMGYTLKDSYKNGKISSEPMEDEDFIDRTLVSNSSNIKVNFGLLAALVSVYFLS